jgi:HlyD family secretion protein
LLALVLFACGGGGDEVRYETAEVDKGDVVSRVTASGTLSALVTVQVGSQVSGRVQEIAVDFNTSVREGELLARIDPGIFESNLEQARANLKAAKSRLASAKAKALDAQRRAERAASLHQQSVLSQAEADSAEAEHVMADADVLAAEGSVAQAEAGVHQAELNLAYTEIVSPIDGVVISRAVDVGQTVAASFQAPVLFTIAQDLARMQVQASVSEADVGKLADGRPASFTVDAWPERKFDGVISQVRYAPQIVQNVVTYQVMVDVENPERVLRPGMTANVTFEVERRDDVIRVPNSALRYVPPSAEKQKPTDGMRTVWILDDGAPVGVPIKAGITDGSFTEVAGGALAPGALVVTDSSGGASPSSGGSPFMPTGGRRR